MVLPWSVMDEEIVVTIFLPYWRTVQYLNFHLYLRACSDKSKAACYILRNDNGFHKCIVIILWIQTVHGAHIAVICFGDAEKVDDGVCLYTYCLISVIEIVETRIYIQGVGTVFETTVCEYIAYILDCHIQDAEFIVVGSSQMTVGQYDIFLVDDFRIRYIER